MGRFERYETQDVNATIFAKLGWKGLTDYDNLWVKRTFAT